MLYKKTAIILTTALALAAAAVAPASARPWHRHHGWGWGGSAAAGFATGAIIGGALASRPYGYGYGYRPYAYAPPAVVYEDDAYAAGSDRDDAYCAQRYRSYDPRSGTYLGYDGARHPCP
jgi:hypothetical protein